MDIAIFEERESNVRSYCRSFPDVFCRAKGSILYNETGKEYIDFLSGAGALNYGHNNGYIKQKVLRYLEDDGISHSLDLYTAAKRQFLHSFVDTILKPRKLDYKIQFCGPTGSNSVEAALKLARKVKGRHNIFSFAGAYHGMSLGSLSVSGSLTNRAGAGVPLTNVAFFPYPTSTGAEIDTLSYIESILADPWSGVEKPAAIIVETIQAEGGIMVAPVEWLQRLMRICHSHDILFICDDVQVGCGRTGNFFSFERADIVPDMVILSKSISGYGMPMSLLLIKPECDVWKPGEHTGTFRGHQLSFVGATAALEYREIYDVDGQVRRKASNIHDFLLTDILSLHKDIRTRGMGLIWGVDLSAIGGEEAAKEVSSRCFERGLIIECVGRNNAVLKILPPLTIEDELLQQGCLILKQALEEYLLSGR